MYCWSNFHFFPLELTIKGSSALSFCSTSLPRSESLGGHLRSSRQPPFSSMRFRKPSSQPITCNKHAADIITHVYIYVVTTTQTLSTNKQQISSHKHICCNNHTGSVNTQQASSHNHTCIYVITITQQSHMYICHNI